MLFFIKIQFNLLYFSFAVIDSTIVVSTVFNDFRNLTYSPSSFDFMLFLLDAQWMVVDVVNHARTSIF